MVLTFINCVNQELNYHPSKGQCCLEVKHFKYVLNYIENFFKKNGTFDTLFLSISTHSCKTSEG